MNSLKILIVEDNKAICDLVVEAFEEVCAYNGCRLSIDHTAHGLEGIEMHQRNKYHLLIVDLVLPDTTGMDVIRRIRGEDRIVEFIIVTGWPTLETAVEAISLDVWAYFMKPFDLSALLAQAKKAIDNSTLKRKIMALAEWSDKILGK